MTAPVPPVRHRWFAAFYDRLEKLDEKRMRELRPRIARAAHGRVLELGAGTGLNLQHYPATVTGLVLTEPDPHMRAVLKRRVARTPRLRS